MDPFSHLLLGYLIGFGIWGPSGIQYVVAAAVAAALPDADIFLYPLGQHVPLFRHRGLFHSVVGVSLIAGVGTFVAPPILGWALGGAFASGSRPYFFVAMELGGLSHVLLDALDHWSVQIFAPFSMKEYHFDAERIVNVGSMAFTVSAYAILLYERGRVATWIWQVTGDTLLVLAVLYLATRLFTRWLAGRAVRREGFSAAIPQVNPLQFRFIDEQKVDTLVRVRTGMYDLRKGFLRPPELTEVRLGEIPSGPVTKSEEALARSYPPALEASWILSDTYHFARARSLPGCFEVFWYSLEMGVAGRFAGVLARVDAATGHVTTKNLWRDPARVFGGG